jgi:hypothetical protein
MDIKDDLFDLFQQEHPEEVQYILNHGVPEGQTFLSYLQDLCQRTYERSLQETQQKEYAAAMHEDLLLFEYEDLKAKLRNVTLLFSKDDKRALLLKQYDPKESALAEEKLEMVTLLKKLQTEVVPKDTFVKNAKTILAYVESIANKTK